MNEPQSMKLNPITLSGATEAQTPVWRLVFKQEMIELWLRGRVLVFLIFFTFLMSFTSAMREWESQLSSIPPREIIHIVIDAAISFGLFIGLILGADSISGERERATLESLLLTPTSRRQIVIGKFLAALSPWPVCFALSLPYIIVMAHGNSMLGQGLLAGFILGTFLAVAFTGCGMLTSIWSKYNKNSLFISLLVYILFLIPTLWPGWAQKGDLGYLMQKMNPVQGATAFMAKFVVNNRKIYEVYDYALPTIVCAVVVLVLLIAYAPPRLNLEGESRLNLPQRRLRVAGLLLVGLLIAALQVAPLRAASPAALSAAILHAAEQPLQITVDMDHKLTSTGDRIEFNTVVTNKGNDASLPFNVSMNIIKIGTGDPVDPEDWSPERSQEINSLKAGESAEQSWAVDMILSGNFMVYMTVVPIPVTPDASTQTFSSKGIHFTVKQTPNANPGGVLPFAIGIPLALTALTLFVRRRFRRGGESGRD